jgi:hypothetical protein
MSHLISSLPCDLRIVAPTTPAWSLLSRDLQFGLPGRIDFITGRQLPISKLQFLGTFSLGAVLCQMARRIGQTIPLACHIASASDIEIRPLSR